MMDRFRDLVVLTVLRPAEAIEAILALKLPVRVSWAVLVLGLLTSTVMIFLRAMLHPIEVLPGVLFLDAVTPFGLFTTMILVAASGAALLTFSGRQIGGEGRFAQVLAFVAWLQVMRAVVETLALVMSFVAFGLSVIAINLAGLYGLWILLHFQNRTHGFNSLLRAGGSLALAFVGMVVIATVFVAPFISV